MRAGFLHAIAEAGDFILNCHGDPYWTITKSDGFRVESKGLDGGRYAWPAFNGQFGWDESRGGWIAPSVKAELDEAAAERRAQKNSYYSALYGGRPHGALLRMEVSFGAHHDPNAEGLLCVGGTLDGTRLDVTKGCRDVRVPLPGPICYIATSMWEWRPNIAPEELYVRHTVVSPAGRYDVLVLSRMVRVGDTLRIMGATYRAMNLVRRPTGERVIAKNLGVHGATEVAELWASDVVWDHSCQVWTVRPGAALEHCRSWTGAA